MTEPVTWGITSFKFSSHLSPGGSLHSLSLSLSSSHLSPAVKQKKLITSLPDNKQLPQPNCSEKTKEERKKEHASAGESADAYNFLPDCYASSLLLLLILLPCGHLQMRQKLQAPDPTSSERRPILPLSSLHRPIGAGVIFLSSLVRVFCVSLSLYEKYRIPFVCLFGYFANLTLLILLFCHIYGFSMCCDTHKFQRSF